MSTLPKIANRRSVGTTARNSSIRLAAISVVCSDRPVTLAPGRAELATRPLPTGSPVSANTIGMTDVAFFAAAGAVAYVTMTPTFESDELGRDLGEALTTTLGPAILDRDRPPLDPAELAQSMRKSGGPQSVGRRRGHPQEPDGRQLHLLRAR